MPTLVYSDQAGYFSRAKEELKESFSALNECMVELQGKGRIVWKMNPSKAPHDAGVWGRLVKSTKHVLLKICSNSFLKYVEFQTVLKETQALLNDRPLVALSDDAMDVITLSMLTHGKKLRQFREFLEESEIPGKIQAKIRWQHRTEVMDHLYNLWRKQYRMSLQRAKWFTKQPNHRYIIILIDEQAKSFSGVSWI